MKVLRKRGPKVKIEESNTVSTQKYCSGASWRLIDLGTLHEYFVLHEEGDDLPSL